MPIPTDEERIGQLVGNYRLDRILGKGGMGVVYAATHHRISQLRGAVKFLQPHWAQQPEIVERFVREAQAAAMLKHPNVCAVSDVGVTDDGAPYMVLEYLEGQSLADILAERGTLPPQELYRYLGPVMSAVAFAHDQGIIHRDLKPENIFVSRHGSEIVPKVLDFGIAKLSIEQSNNHQTTAPIGTVLYMSPEQAMVKDIGPWCDVWSMGVIMYQSLTGQFPFDFPEDAGIVQMISVVVGQKPIPIVKRGTQHPSAILDVVDRALAIDPRQRYRHMRDLDAAFRKTLDRISTSVTLPTPDRLAAEAASGAGNAAAASSGSRMPLVAIGAVAVVALAAAGAWAMSGGASPESPAPGVATPVIEAAPEPAAEPEPTPAELDAGAGSADAGAATTPARHSGRRPSWLRRITSGH